MVFPIHFSDVKITVNVPEAEEVAFTLVTNKKYKGKIKVPSLSFISFFNSRSKTLLILQTFSFYKAITTCLVLKPMISCPSSTVISSLAITTSKNIKLPQITSSSVFLASKSNLKVKSFT